MLSFDVNPLNLLYGPQGKIKVGYAIEKHVKCVVKYKTVQEIQIKTWFRRSDFVFPELPL